MVEPSEKKVDTVSAHDQEWIDDWHDEEASAEVGIHYCVFKSAATYYMIPLEMVSEVVRSKFITPVPHVPKHILGMANVRGEIRSIFDLQVFLGEPSGSKEEPKYFIVINDEEVSVAIAVPSVPDTIRVVESEVQPLLNVTKEIKRPNYLGGVLNRDGKMIISLKIKDIIESEDFVKSSPIETA